MTAPCPGGCEHTIGRLSKELAVEIAKNARAALVNELIVSRLFAAQERIDQLEHELATVGGTAMVAEVEQYLQENGP
jgi:hypothetical protein